MRITVSESKAQLTELAPRAESAEEIILTRHGAALDCLIVFDGEDFARTDLVSALLETGGIG